MDYVELVWRVLEFVLTSVAFSCMGAALPGSPVALAKYHTFNFLLAANVLACLYSVAQITALPKRAPGSVAVWISSIFDLIFAYLLLASASAATASFTALRLCSQDRVTCMRVTASLVAAFLAFITFAVFEIIELR